MGGEKPIIARLKSLSVMSKIVVRNILTDIRMRNLMMTNFLEAVVIDYCQAILLASAHENICVYDTYSGDMFNFNEVIWKYTGINTSQEDMCLEYGNLDNIYKFVWFKHRKPS
jgi:hypothetical protein